MKMLVETPGDFMLMDTFANQEVSAHRPSVVENSSFINQRIATQFLRPLGNLKDEATDVEFAKYFAESEGDSNLAVESFLSAFALEAITTKSTPPKGSK